MHHDGMSPSRAAMPVAQPQNVSILAIDDEPHNLKIIELALEDMGRRVMCAPDGEAGWELLQQHKETIEVIVLDRQMPHLDGMGFMRRLKQDESVAHIPAVMQTAAVLPQQVIEGIATGVYYYLTKPYEPEMLQSIVGAALSDFAKIKRRATVREGRYVHAVETCELKLRHCEEVEQTCALLCEFFPDPDRVALGISELLINAIEHGNLGISYAEKSSLQARGCLQQEIRRRLYLPEHAKKQVRVRFYQEGNDKVLHIADEGEGFNWQSYMEISPDRVTDIHGRGIALSRMLSFDAMRYLGAGNEVECRILAA